MERLDKVLAATGRWSRSQAKALVKGGRVLVDGRPAQRAEDKIGEEAVITVDGHPIRTARTVWLMLHKPQGVVSSTEDPRERTVLSLLPPELRRIGLFPVGRLDKDTEGLLLLTNDGAAAHRLLAPGRHVDKVCRPAGLSVGDAPDRCLVTIHEGKYHQVKRMLAARGKPVRYLKRLSMGPLSLDPALPLGAWRPLRPDEVALLEG